MDGPDSQTTLNRPSALAYDAAANEVFVADTGNRRIVVFDADKGTYKRHWFAYGEKRHALHRTMLTGRSGGDVFRDVTCVGSRRRQRLCVRSQQQQDSSVPERREIRS
jgi:uncharacterized protein YodC (DUF2158 family)